MGVGWAGAISSLDSQQGDERKTRTLRPTCSSNTDGVSCGYSTEMLCSSTGTTVTVALVKLIVKSPVIAELNVLNTNQ